MLHRDLTLLVCDYIPSYDLQDWMILGIDENDDTNWSLTFIKELFDPTPFLKNIESYNPYPYGCLNSYLLKHITSEDQNIEYTYDEIRLHSYILYIEMQINHNIPRNRQFNNAISTIIYYIEPQREKDLIIKQVNIKEIQTIMLKIL